MMKNFGYHFPQLVLASQSPRRKTLLEQIGLEFTTLPADIDETRFEGELPEAYVQRIAREKAEVHLNELPESHILGADTIVVLDKAIFFKPTDADDHRKMLAALSGKTHRVLTAVAVASQTKTAVIMTDTAVTFRDLTAEEITAYWLSGEPQDKAGGYALQGLGAVFIKSIVGSWTGVIGLPLPETLELLQSHYGK